MPTTYEYDSGLTIAIPPGRWQGVEPFQLADLAKDGFDPLREVVVSLDGVTHMAEGHFAKVPGTDYPRSDRYREAMCRCREGQRVNPVIITDAQFAERVVEPHCWSWENSLFGPGFIGGRDGYRVKDDGGRPTGETRWLYWPSHRHSDFFVGSQILGIDVDGGAPWSETRVLLQTAGLLPTFCYDSGGCSCPGGDHDRFRIICLLDDICTDLPTLKRAMSGIARLVGGDAGAAEGVRYFWGGRSLIFENFGERSNLEEVLTAVGMARPSVVVPAAALVPATVVPGGTPSTTQADTTTNGDAPWVIPHLGERLRERCPLWQRLLAGLDPAYDGDRLHFHELEHLYNNVRHTVGGAELFHDTVAAALAAHPSWGIRYHQWLDPSFLASYTGLPIRCPGKCGEADCLNTDSLRTLLARTLDPETVAEPLVDLTAEGAVPAATTGPARKNGGGASSAEVAGRLVRMVTKAGHLYRDREGLRYAEVPVQGHPETIVLGPGGGGLRDFMIRQYQQERGQIPNSDALSLAGMAIVAEAAVAPLRTVGLRVASADGHTWLDLADEQHRAVRIDGDGWVVTDQLPGELRFRRSGGTRALRPPVRDANGLEQLRKLLHPRDVPGGFVLMASWALAALRPDVPYPVLLLIGEKGTGKSTVSAIWRLLLDPFGEDGRGLVRPPHQDSDLFAIAANSHLMAFENLSTITSYFSDSISALATGTGIMRRRLYTDSDVASTWARRPIIMNGIASTGADLASKTDLLDRCLVVPLGPLAYVSERNFWPHVHRLGPAILGDLLDALVMAMRNLPGLDPGPLPRMADFAELVIAAEEALPWAVGTFMNSYGDNHQQASAQLLEDDPLATHITALARNDWRGSPAELMATLDDMATIREKREKRWPATANALGRRLTTLAPGLRERDVRFEREKTERARGYHLWCSSDTPPQADPSPPDEADEVEFPDDDSEAHTDEPNDDIGYF